MIIFTEGDIGFTRCLISNENINQQNCTVSTSSNGTEKKGIYYDYKRRRCSEASETARCFEHCIEKKLFKELNCSLPYLPPNNLPDCNTEEMFNQTLDFTQNLLMSTSNEDCGCPRKCIENFYDFKISTAQMKYVPFLIVYMYYPVNNVLVITEVPLLNFYTMFAKVCGNIGLYLGFSFLTLFELIQAIWRFLLKKLNSLKRNPYVKRCIRNLMFVR